MRNVKLSTPDRDILAGDAVTLERKRALLRAIDETYFTVDFAPGLMIYEGGLITTPKNGNIFAARIPATAAGTNPSVYKTVSARKLWPRTIPRLKLWYTSPVGSTNTFSVRFVLWVIGAGALTSATAIFATDMLVPGPTIANTEMFATVKGGAMFPSSPFGGAEFRIGRLGGDANANDLDILLAQVVMEESA
jgi:hypothetical protein